MRFSDLFAKFIVRFRWPIVILVLLVTLYFTYLMRHVTLPLDHPWIQSIDMSSILPT